MFTDIIKNGIFEGKSNSEIITDIEKICQTTISGSSADFINEDIEWFRFFIIPKAEVK
jgi:hypothetical protein